MKICLSFLLLLLSLGISHSQSKVDSIINRFNPNNIPQFNQQLYATVDHSLLQKIEPDRTKWPELLRLIASKVVRKTENFEPSIQAIAFAHMAEVLVRDNRSGIGYTYMQHALELSKNLKGIPVAYTYYKYADIFRFVNRLDSAVYYSEKGLDIANELKVDSIKKVCLDQMGVLCYKMKNFFKAEFYFKKLVAHPLSNTSEKRSYYNTLALTYRKREIYDSAVHFFNQGLNLAIQTRDTVWIGLIQGNIGYTYFLQKDYAKALNGLSLDVYYGFKKNNRESAINALTSVVEIYMLQNRMDKAKILYDSMTRNINGTSTEVHLEFYKVSADYFQRRGQMENAVKFLKKYLTLNDSLNDMQNHEHAAQLEAQFEFDRQVRQIRSLELLSASQAKENSLKNYFLVATLIIIVLGGVLMYVQYRNSKFKNSTNKILQEQATHLNELNATKDKLFAIIGHDMRGPINSLKGLLTLLKNRMISKEEFESFSSDLLTNVDRVHFTLNNLLQWSSTQLKGMKTKAESILLRDTVIENFELLNDQATLKDLKLINHIDAAKIVTSDPDHLRLVFRNLISNAIKFTNVGGSITVSSISENGKEIVSVIDTGVGMTEQERNLLFNPVNRHSTIGTEGERGTGLGVQLCKEMVEKNGGTMWVESEKGKGTSMKFSLPLVKEGSLQT